MATAICRAASSARGASPSSCASNMWRAWSKGPSSGGTVPRASRAARASATRPSCSRALIRVSRHWCSAGAGAGASSSSASASAPRSFCSSSAARLRRMPASCGARIRLSRSIASAASASPVRRMNAARLPVAAAWPGTCFRASRNRHLGGPDGTLPIAREAEIDPGIGPAGGRAVAHPQRLARRRHHSRARSAPRPEHTGAGLREGQPRKPPAPRPEHRAGRPRCAARCSGRGGPASLMRPIPARQAVPCGSANGSPCESRASRRQCRATIVARTKY